MDTTPAKKPVQRPARRGVYMDFAPRRPIRQPQRPQQLQSSQPVRPATKPRPAAHPRPAVKPHAPLKPVQHQTIVHHTEEKRTTILYPDADTVATETTQTSYNTRHQEEFLDMDTSLGVIEDVDLENATDMEKAAAEFIEEPRPLDTTTEKKPFFNVKSPFITTKVEKRPLSGDKPSPEAQAQKKISYPRRTDLAKKPEHDDKVPTMVTTSASTRSNVRLIISIIVTVALGALVGTVAYLAFFQ